MRIRSILERWKEPRQSAMSDICKYLTRYTVLDPQSRLQKEEIEQVHQKVLSSAISTLMLSAEGICYDRMAGL